MSLGSNFSATGFAVFFFFVKLQENSLFDTRKMIASLFDPGKKILPYLAPNLNFMPLVTLPAILLAYNV